MIKKFFFLFAFSLFFFSFLEISFSRDLKENKDEVYGSGAGFVITSSQVEEFKKMYVPQNIVLTKRELLNVVLQQKLFSLEASKSGMDQDQELKTKLNMMRDRELSLAYVTENLYKELGITDDILKSYYLSHIEDFTTPTKYKLARIVLKSKIEADELIKLLKEGKSFESLVEKYSIDYFTWKNKGVFGTYTLKQLSPKVAGLVKKLQKGETSKVVELSTGFYYVFKVMDVSVGTRKSFEVVKDEIVPIVVNEKKIEVKKRMAKKLAEKYKFSWKTGVLTDEPTGNVEGAGKK